MADPPEGYIYDPKDGRELRFSYGRVVEYKKFPQHNPDDVIDPANFPHREIIGPTYENFNPHYVNFGTMRTAKNKHHDGEADQARTKASYFKAGYYPCPEHVTLPDGTRVRCLYPFKVYSPGCHDHRFVHGYKSAFRRANHGEKIYWKDFMDPIELVKLEYEVEEEKRKEEASETVFGPGTNYHESVRKMQELEQPFKNLWLVEFDSYYCGMVVGV